MSLFIDPEIAERIEHMELPFNQYGYDPYGISKKHLGFFMTVLSRLYKHYFSVTAYGTEHIPKRGRVMLVGNHSGGVAIDGAMLITSMFMELDPPRLAQGMVEKFIPQMPFVSDWASRMGQFTGLPEHAVQLLEDDRMLMVFPEGARGTAKLYKERNSLVRFGTGFMRLAMQTKTPIVPLSFIGAGEILPTVANLYTLGRLMGVPYIPVTKYLVPVPLPSPCQIHFGEPLFFEGDGTEVDELIEENVEQVKMRIATLLQRGLDLRQEDGHGPSPEQVKAANQEHAAKTAGEGA